MPWSMAGNMPKNLGAMAATSETASSVIVTGGRDQNTTNFGNTSTFLYNSVTWSTLGDSISYGRYSAQLGGISNDCVLVGGYTRLTEHFNGTVWSSGITFDAVIRGLVAVGSSTSDMIVFGGAQENGGSPSSYCCRYNGARWYQEDDMLIARADPAGVGMPLAAVCCGGVTSNGSTATSTEKFNGDYWYTVDSSMSVARSEHSAFGFPIAMVVTGGFTGSISSTEKLDGYIWKTISGDTNIPRTKGAGSGDNTVGIITGGSNNSYRSYYASCEKFGASVPTFSVPIPTLTVTVGSSNTVAVNGTYDTMTATSNNNSIVTTSVSGKNLTLTGMGGGVRNSNLHVY